MTIQAVQSRDPLATSGPPSWALVAGIGNIFMGDDGFGCEVIQRLARRSLPAGVDAVDFGIRGLDLSYALMDGYQLAILVDTAERGGEPGTVHVIEPEIDESQADVVASGEQLIVPHAMDPAKVLRLVGSLGTQRPHVLLVACEPEYLGGEHGHMGLSDAVETGVEQALDEIEQLLAEHESVSAQPVAQEQQISDRTTRNSELAPGG
jgi:hydrogenase maturation protease